MSKEPFTKFEQVNPDGTVVYSVHAINDSIVQFILHDSITSEQLNDLFEAITTAITNSK